MTIYVLVEHDYEDTRIIGATKYHGDAIKYAAERNDQNTDNGNDVICEVEEFNTKNINTESAIMPNIRYVLLFDLDGKFDMINNWNFTYKDIYNVRKLIGSKCYVMEITFDYRVPESTVIEMATQKMAAIITQNEDEMNNEN